MSPQPYAKQRELVIEWLNTSIPHLSLPLEASDEELRACLIDGTILCKILNKLRPNSLDEEAQSENVERFLATMDEIGIPRFEQWDLEKGCMMPVVNCLLGLKIHFISSVEGLSVTSTVTNGENVDGHASPHGSPPPSFGEEMMKASSQSNSQRAVHDPVISEPSAAVLQQDGHKFNEVFQLKQARYADLPVTEIVEMMESSNLDSAPTQTLLNFVYDILDESVETKNGEIPNHVARLLRKVVEQIGRRLSTQADHLRTQNNLYKASEEKHQSRIRELEALVAGTHKDSKHDTHRPQKIKSRRKKNKSWFSTSSVLGCFRPKA